MGADAQGSDTVDDGDVLSVAQAAHRLNIGTSTAYDALRRDEFPVRTVTIGRRQRVLRSDLERYLQGRAEPDGEG